jgi:hypothetical protein
MRRNGTIAVGVVFVAVVSFVIRAFLVFGGLDSPVTVAGGSIHASATNSWYTKSFESFYSASSTRNDNLVLNGLVVDSNGNPASSPLRNTGGWLITFSTKDSNGKPRPGSLLFCSAVSDRHCDGSSLGDNLTVYLEAKPPHRLQEYSSGELRFHDTDSKCDGKENKETGCDKISTITIQTAYPVGGQAVTYRCADETQCSIQVGKPLPLLKVLFDLSRWHK